MNDNRICIYFIYDRDGIIDDYILYQLHNLRPYFKFLHCVINGKCTDIGKKKLEEIVDEVFIRENKGNDIGAYKAAINHIGWENIRKYKELILMNNTCFGPIFPLDNLFAWAENNACDFWGLTLDQKTSWLGTDQYLHSNKSKTHYQSYFLAFRQSLTEKDFLAEFFDEIPYNCSYIESGCFFEYAFPGYFEEHGFKGAVYCDDYQNLDYPLLHDPVYLIRKFNMPFFKKRNFFHIYNDTLNHSAGEATSKLVEYLESHRLYDMTLVWKNLLRTSNLADLVRAANLNRVLPKQYNLANLITESNQYYNDVGFVVHLYYDDSLPEFLPYIQNMNKFGEILFTTSKKEIANKIMLLIKENSLNAQVKLVNNRGRDVSALLVGANAFVRRKEVICFVHDKKSTQIKPYGIGKSWLYKLLENTVASEVFINEVIQLFHREKCLGIAFPSSPNHGHFANSIGDGWTGNFFNTKKLLEAFGLKNKVKEHVLCVAPLGTCFWFRTEALSQIFDGIDNDGWAYEDFPAEPNKNDNTLLHAIERSYAYFAQEKGFYPVYLYSDKYTEIELTSLEFNKMGSLLMQAWNEALASSSLGNGRNHIQLNINSSFSQYSGINWGIRGSLLHLALAIRCKYPFLWSCFFPLRRLGQKILKIKTK